MMCRHCRRYAAQLRAIGQAAGKIIRSGEGADDPEVLQRLEKAILDKCSDPDKTPPG